MRSNLSPRVAIDLRWFLIHMIEQEVETRLYVDKIDNKQIMTSESYQTMLYGEDGRTRRYDDGDQVRARIG